MLHLKRGFTGHSLKLTWVFSSVEIQRRQATSYQKAQFYSPVKTCRFIKIQKLFLLLAGIWPVNRKKTERTKVLGLGPLWMFNQSWLCSAGRCYVQYENSTPPPTPTPNSPDSHTLYTPSLRLSRRRSWLMLTTPVVGLTAKKDWAG